MLTTVPDIQDKLIEIDRRIEILIKLRDKHNNPEGFDMLIADAKERKAKLLKTKVNN